MNWYKKSQQNILISSSEKNWAEWALDPMYDHWCSEEGAWDRNGEIYDESQLPKIAGNNLAISPIPEINEDLLYRLEDQASDVSRTDAISSQQEAARKRGAISLANKIRNIL